MSEKPIPVVVVTPQDRLARFVGKNWKTAAGALIMVASAVAQYRHWIDAPTALLWLKCGGALLGFGIGHKIERLIIAYQTGGNAAALAQLAALLQGQETESTSTAGNGGPVTTQE
jgi:hypothetical protein